MIKVVLNDCYFLSRRSRAEERGSQTRQAASAHKSWKQLVVRGDGLGSGNREQRYTMERRKPISAANPPAKRTAATGTGTTAAVPTQSEFPPETF